MNLKLIFGILFSIVMRFLLMESELADLISRYGVLSTPINSWKSVNEAVYWMNNNLSLSRTNQFHEPPLNYWFYGKLIQLTSENRACLTLVFIFVDLIIAGFVYLIAKEFKSLYRTQFDLDLKGVQPSNMAMLYLLNPLLMLNCVARTTTIFDHLFIFSSVFWSLRGSTFWSLLNLTLATSKSFYPLLLLIPISLQLQVTSKSKLSWILFVFLVQSTSVFYLSAYYSGNWSFLQNVYGFIINVANIRPGIGIFWYFFAEMFDQFRNFFIYLIQVNIWLLYSGPLTVQHRNEPMFLLTLFLILIAIFKTYPCLADIGLYLTFLPLWNHLLKFMQQSLIVFSTMIVTLLLSPIFWYLWIYVKSANANFYFGIMIAFVTAQVFLLVDLLIASARRKFVFENFDEIRQVDSIKAKTRLILE